MKHLFLFETFIEFGKERQSKKETPKNTHLIYNDDKMSIKVVKTLDSSRAISDPAWCSTQKYGFYRHNLTANMYRFIFKDGYMLRLTWDYFPWAGDYSGGTHWGQGGTIDGKKMHYTYIRPKNENNPFYFDYHKNDDRKYMVDRIKKIPQAAIDAIYRYQESKKQEKMAIFQNMYKEIENIKIIEVKPTEDKFYKNHEFYDVIVTYRGKNYTIITNLREWTTLPDNLEKDFKSKYAIFNRTTIDKYISDKIKEWMKKHRVS